MPGKTLDEREYPFHLTHVVDPRVSKLVEARFRVWVRHTPQRRGETPLGAAPVPDHVRRDPIQPGQHLVRQQLLVPAPPGLQKHDREQILSNRPVANPAKAEVVDRPCVPLEQQPEGIDVTSTRTRPEHRVGELHHPLMSEARRGVPDDAHPPTVGRLPPERHLRSPAPAMLKWTASIERGSAT